MFSSTHADPISCSCISNIPSSHGPIIWVGWVVLSILSGWMEWISNVHQKLIVKAMPPHCETHLSWPACTGHSGAKRPVCSMEGAWHLLSAVGHSESLALPYQESRDACPHIYDRSSIEGLLHAVKHGRTLGLRCNWCHPWPGKAVCSSGA